MSAVPAQVWVLGGGIAGVAAAVAAAHAGARTVLVERRPFLGGQAVVGDHRTLCGLAPIDAAHADLLEPALTAAWIPRLTSGAPFRRGRVWLWPTTAEHLTRGCAAALAAAGVDTRLGRAPDDPTAQLPSDGTWTMVDASGAAAFHSSGTRPPRYWGAVRGTLLLAIAPGPAARLALLRRLADLAPASALEALGVDRWQLSLDVPPGCAADHATALLRTAATALGGELLSTTPVAERDDGGYAGPGLAQLFAERNRGLCWAAWPGEEHGADGLRWTWPAGDRHGVPSTTVMLPGRPGWWCCGRGMAVAPDAAAALRVTGTALAIGTVVGGLAAGGTSA